MLPVEPEAQRQPAHDRRGRVPDAGEGPARKRLRVGGASGRLAKSASSEDAKQTVVMDAGIANEEKLEWLRSEGCH